MKHRLALLVTGASGMALPKAVLTAMARSPEVERVHLVVSRGASQVLQHELSRRATGAADLIDTGDLTEAARDKIRVHRDNELDAAISSGSYRLTGTAVIPCSAGTLGALATGSAGTLIHRAGAVALKEQWPLVLGFRETPLTTIHLENLRRLAYLRAVILPPVPAFYVGGEDFNRFLDHYVLRVLDRFGIHEPGDDGLRWS
ncbi:MAG: UbiX family flavin prenyltransferase [Nitrospirae bacterium]|nr:UbiX family flavin prenyltransferase [Nitrospirota bacterium]